MINLRTAKKLPKVDSVGGKRGVATGQQGGTGGRVINVTHDESSSQQCCNCCYKN